MGVEGLTESTKQAVRDVVQGVLNSDRKAQYEGLFQCPGSVIVQIVDALHAITDHAIRESYDATPKFSGHRGSRKKRASKKKGD